jgi:hypothetical protein
MEHAISDTTFEALQKHAQQYLGKTSED